MQIDPISALLGFFTSGGLMWLAGMTVIMIYADRYTWWQLIFWMWVYPYYFFGSFFVADDPEEDG